MKRFNRYNEIYNLIDSNYSDLQKYFKKYALLFEWCVYDKLSENIEGWLEKLTDIQNLNKEDLGELITSLNNSNTEINIHIKPTLLRSAYVKAIADDENLSESFLNQFTKFLTEET